jgi:hypothetical protein
MRAHPTADTRSSRRSTENHGVVSQEEWLAERQNLLAHEKELRRLRDQIVRKRRALPWVDPSTLKAPGEAMVCRRRNGMREAYTGGGMREPNGGNLATGVVDFLSLAGAPTFAAMALLTGFLAVGSPDMLCSATQDAAPLNGMVLMYVLMSAFHSVPWLKLLSNRRIGVRRR